MYKINENVKTTNIILHWMVSGELIYFKKIKGLNWGVSNLSTYFNIKLLR